MGYARNPHVLALLEWHGHSAGGVRVPFSMNMGRPMGASVIQVPVMDKLDGLAIQIVDTDPHPRFVFLVGGPGNGKSAAVETFISRLDDLLSCSGSLEAHYRAAYASGDTVARRIDATAADVVGGNLASHVGRLIIVQDASSAEGRSDDAAAILVDEVTSLLASEEPLLYVCCVNRGVLARARATQTSDPDSQRAVAVLSRVADATSVAGIAATGDDSSWPVPFEDPALDGVVAAWPLDLESLMTIEVTLPGSALGGIMAFAAQQGNWEGGPCGDCDAAPLCPFLRNAQRLRHPDRQEPLRQILRRAELGLGKRWNFRELFSITAEIMVGEHEDFEDAAHPCDWVAAQMVHASGPSGAIKVAALHRMVQRQYEQALFPEDRVPAPSRQLLMPEPRALRDVMSDQRPVPEGRIRLALIRGVQALLDPAATSPVDRVHPLRRLEDGFSQSVALGLRWWTDLGAQGHRGPETLESLLLEALVNAEESLDLLARDSVQPFEAWALLRVYSAAIAKRALGVNEAEGGPSELVDYERALHDEYALDDIRQTLLSFLGETNFVLPATAAFGQVRDGGTPVVALVERRAPHVGVIGKAPSRDAAATEATRAGHDFPIGSIEGEPIILTFELYRSLIRHQLGGSPGSVPASVRARFDLMRQLHAGRLSHEAAKFRAMEAQLEFGEFGSLLVTSANDLRFRPRRLGHA